MYKFFIVIILSTTFILSCKNKDKNNANKIAASDTAKAFPVIDLLTEDANDVQRIPYFLYKKTAIGKDKKQKDSVAVSREDLKKIVAPILQINLSKDKYKEGEAFHDLTTKSYAIITTAIDKNLEVKSVQSLLSDETNKLKSVFILVEKNAGDSSVQINYYWKTGKSLSIATTTTYKNGQTKEKTELINWNDRDE
jgi:hypothetical protein